MGIINWQGLSSMIAQSYVCGYCGSSIASQQGYISKGPQGNRTAFICICHKCQKPTFFDTDNSQTPGSIFGNNVLHVQNDEIGNLYNEARRCYTIKAFTSCVMCCRKLLMNIAVIEGASEGKNFVEYVDYLDAQHYIPPKGRVWVDTMRKLGNEANHKIEFRSETDAKNILIFSEMLLKFIYELPALHNLPPVV